LFSCFYGEVFVKCKFIRLFVRVWISGLLLDGLNSKWVFVKVMGNPYPLRQNAGKSFQGSIVLGKGFVLEPEQAQALIAKDARNKEVLFPYLNGEDLNNDPQQQPSRWVINFFDWSEERARSYPDCFEIVERLVKPERMEYDENKNAWNKAVKKNWWQFGAWRKTLDETISKVDQVMVVPLVSKYSVFVFAPTHLVFMHKLGVITLNTYFDFALLNSTIHNIWCWKNSSTLGAGTLNYSSTDCFETFPLPQNPSSIIEKELNELGNWYNRQRAKISECSGLGLTKIYNQFHNADLVKINEDEFYLDSKTISKKYGKETANLLNYLQKKSLSDKFNIVCEEIFQLRKLHIKIDYLILQAYNWEDIDLKHDFYELEYLPEKDRIRFTIHPQARKEVLKRLLILNHKVHKEEGDIKVVDNKKKRRKDSETMNDLFD